MRGKNALDIYLISRGEMMLSLSIQRSTVFFNFVDFVALRLLRLYHDYTGN